MYHTVYKITNLWEQKFYIGMHSTKNLNDGYMGSGKEIKKALNWYGRFFLHKEILYFCQNRKTAQYVEHMLITEALRENPDLCYNLTTRYGGGNFGGKPRFGEDNHFYGKRHTPESIKKMSESLKERGFKGERNPFYGKKHKPETIEKANRKREEGGTYYIDKNPNRLKAMYAKDGYWWCTPEGCFHSSAAASKYTGFTKGTIQQRCSKGDEGIVITANSRIPKEWVGKTWKEVGYYRIPRKGYDLVTRKPSYKRKPA